MMRHESEEIADGKGAERRTSSSSSRPYSKHNLSNSSVARMDDQDPSKVNRGTHSLYSLPSLSKKSALSTETVGIVKHGHRVD